MHRKYMQVKSERKMEVIKSKTIKYRDENRSRDFATISSLAVLIGLAMYVYTCYTTNMFLSEALVCSTIIVAILFYRTAEQNGDYTKHT